MNDCKISSFVLKHTKIFTRKYQDTLNKSGIKSEKATNPYTWRYKVIYGKDYNCFDAIFDKCGICNLYKDLGIFEIVPALCAYDYEMAKYYGSEFNRKMTLASGSKVCDCHYKKEISK